MEVKIFKWANVTKRCERDVIMRTAFENFREQLNYCDWKMPSDITKSFRTADMVVCAGKSYNRIVFNVGGNKYRLICGYSFGKSRVILYIRFLGTHKEYDKVKVCEVDLF